MDTLYFIYDNDATTADLYLGSKLISSGANDESVGATELAKLSDVIIGAGLASKDLLVYDATAGTDGAWVNKPLHEAISVMIGANSTSDGQAGLVPAPGAGVANRYLRSDGKWVAITAQVFELENEEKANHIELINSNTTGKTLAIGDIAIVKDVIVEGKCQHTAYVYDGAEWAAMDGNYNAETVYFDEDFIFTKAIGTVTIPSSGSKKVEAAGKNLREFFAGLFAAEADPTVSTKVSASMTLQSAKSVEAGTSYTPSYSITFNKGKYSYGPDTGITATYAVTDTNGGSKTDASGKFDAFTVEDDTAYKISATVSYTQGAIPVSNLGNPVESKRIPAGTISLNSDVVKGYRNAFYGTLTEKGELTSDIIRGLTATNADVAAGSVMTVNVPVGAMRVVIAYEATLQDLTSVLDKNDSNANIVSGFGEPRTIAVEGANKHNPINYKVYVMDFANPYDAANTFTATI